MSFIAGAIILGCITVITIPFQIYFITYISSQDRNPAITNRNVTLTLITLYTILLFEIINSINIILYIILNNKWSLNIYILFIDICHYGITLIYTLRSFDLYYHINWANESVNNLWKSQLLGPG